MLVFYQLLTLCATFIAFFIIPANLAGLSPVGKFRTHFLYDCNKPVKALAIEVQKVAIKCSIQWKLRGFWSSPEQPCPGPAYPTGDVSQKSARQESDLRRFDQAPASQDASSPARIEEGMCL